MGITVQYSLRHLDACAYMYGVGVVHRDGGRRGTRLPRLPAIFQIFRRAKPQSFVSGMHVCMCMLDDDDSIKAATMTL